MHLEISKKRPALFYILLVFLGFYIVVEAWMAVTLINTSTINETLGKRDYQRLGEFVTAVGFVINFLLSALKSQSMKIKKVLLFLILLSMFTFLIIIFMQNSFLVMLLTLAILVGLIFSTKIPYLGNLIASILLVYLLAFSFMKVVEKGIDAFIYLTSQQQKLCSLTGELAHNLSQKGEMNISDSWVQGNEFQTIERYQLERRFVSIIACNNDEFLRTLLTTKGMKEGVYDLIFDKNSVDKYSKLLANYDELYDGYYKLSKLKRGIRYKHGYKQMLSELREREVSNPIRLLSAMGLTETRYTYSRTGTKKELFQIIMSKYIGLKGVSYKESPKDFEQNQMRKPFDEKYQTLVETLNFADFVGDDDSYEEEYKTLGRINITIIISILAIIYSSINLILFIIRLFVKAPKNLIIRIMFNRIFLLLYFVLIVNSINKEKVHNDFELFNTSNVYFHIKQVLFLQAKFYPEAKGYFNKLGVPPWLTTYSFFSQVNQDKDIAYIKEELNTAMKAMQYTTPIQNSALYRIEQLFYLNEYDDDVKAKMIFIENYYEKNRSKKGNEDKLSYISKKRDEYENPVYDFADEQ